MKRVRDDLVDDLADLSVPLPWDEPQAPPSKAQRVKGRKYLFKGEVRVWSGTVFNCRHNRRKRQCKECGGASICEHNRQRFACKECGGSSICEHNRQRSQCKECGGASICEHNRRRSQCKECGGASICEHNRQRARCKDCLTLEEMIRCKYRCTGCGANVFRNRRDIGLCAACDSTQRERIEHKARRLLLSHMPAPYNLEAHWSALDSQLIGGDACQTARRRPDMMSELEDRVIGFEIDENSHAGRELSCETAKLDDHRWGVVATGQSTKPAVCVRLNPDPRGPNDPVTFEQRCRLAAEQLLYYAQCPLDQLHALGTVVVYVCYGANGQKHIDEARRYPHFRVAVVDA